jgi:hypothetical protein
LDAIFIAAPNHFLMLGCLVWYSQPTLVSSLFHSLFDTRLVLDFRIVVILRLQSAAFLRRMAAFFVVDVL